MSFESITGPRVERNLWLLLGAQQVFHPGEVVDPGGIAVTMVANDGALENVVLGEDGFLEQLGSNLNDMRFDLRRGEQGMGFITDSSAQTNGMIVVDLASGQSWRRLHEHPSTKGDLVFIGGRTCGKDHLVFSGYESMLLQSFYDNLPGSTCHTLSAGTVQSRDQTGVTTAAPAF